MKVKILAEASLDGDAMNWKKPKRISVKGKRGENQDGLCRVTRQTDPDARARCLRAPSIDL
jgi:hypothetical protein